MINTLTELYQVLKTLNGISVAYDHFPEASEIPLPVLVYRVSNSNNFGADNSVYLPVMEIQAELYTVKKEPAIEAQVEDLLGNNDIFWEKEEIYLDSEKCYQIIYTFQI